MPMMLWDRGAGREKGPGMPVGGTEQANGGASMRRVGVDRLRYWSTSRVAGTSSSYLIWCKGCAPDTMFGMIQPFITDGATTRGVEPRRFEVPEPMASLPAWLRKM